MRIKVDTVKVAIIVGASVSVLAWVMVSFSIMKVWPAFMVMLLWILGGQKKQDILKAFCGCAVGIVIGYLSSLGIGSLAPSIGLVPSLMIMLFIAIALTIVLEDVLPVFFNTYSSIFFLIASAPDKQTPVLWLITLVIFGLIFVYGVNALINLIVVKPAIKKAQNVQATNGGAIDIKN